MSFRTRYVTVTLLVSAEQEVEEDFRETEVFVDRSVFDKCRPQIQPFIDISTLKPYLHKYGLIRGEDDNYQLSDKVAPSVRKAHLFDSLTNGAGNYGHHLLYMCIREAKQSLGHQSAAELLKNNGRLVPVDISSSVNQA